jgi:beta-mannosidase
MTAQRQITLHNNWTFQQSGSNKTFPAEVPGVVHLDLLRHDQIPDPFYGTHEEQVQWIENENWEYQLQFDLEDLDASKNYELVFEGLDTYAEVRLNGQNILSANNMFRKWQVDVGAVLKKAGNQLHILFKSPIRVNQEKLSGPPYHKTAGNDAGQDKVSVYTRKAPYHFGWDWGPRMVSCGIWRPVYLLEWNHAKIEDFQVYQKALSEEQAALEAHITIDQDNQHDFVLKIRDLESQQVLAEKKAADPNPLEWSIDQPEWWWPHNLGEPHLYQWQAEVWKKDTLLDTQDLSYGLRNIELIQEKDSIGEAFYFKVNGQPVFMKGANYIPSDALLPRRTKADIDRLLVDAKAVNMNMIRVWGGGIYEEDYFYQRCDELGILIWQDFMFACSMYPADEPFFSNIKAEVEQNIRRLRNHPSIAIWCGNNEVDVAWHNWGWQVQYLISKKNQQKMWGDYQKIFHQAIPDILKEVDPHRPYTSTSPLSNWGKLKNFDYATMHFWGVWHGRQPFSDYKIYVGRFVTEYGFQSFPDWKTIQAFASEEDQNLQSQVMKNHQKSYIGNGMIASHTRAHFKKPKNFQDFVYKSQLTQQIGIRTAIQAHRARKGHCMGTLYWQLNDCWPGPSWSSIDYFGRWKALHYDLQELYADILIVPDQDHESLRVRVVTDELIDREIILRVAAYRLNGKKIAAREYQLSLPANSANTFVDLNWKKLIKGSHRKASYLEISVVDDGKLLAKTLHQFVVPRSMRLKKPTISLKTEGNKVLVQTDTFVKGFYLFSGKKDIHFSQNYVDLQAEKTYVFEADDLNNLVLSDLKYLFCN